MRKGAKVRYPRKQGKNEEVKRLKDLLRHTANPIIPVLFTPIRCSSSVYENAPQRLSKDPALWKKPSKLSGTFWDFPKTIFIQIISNVKILFYNLNTIANS